MDVLGMQSSQVNIPWVAWKSSVKAAMSLMEVIQRVAASALWVEIPTAPAVASSPDPSMGEEGLQADLDTAIGADASSLDLKAARILLEVVAATWEVHWFREILPTTSRVPGYSEKPVTQKKIESCMFDNHHSSLNIK
jgi:hypothetical protein